MSGFKTKAVLQKGIAFVFDKTCAWSIKQHCIK